MCLMSMCFFFLKVRGEMQNGSGTVRLDLQKVGVTCGNLKCRSKKFQSGTPARGAVTFRCVVSSVEANRKNT